MSLFVASFVGGGLRVFFSPDQLNLWLTDILKNEQLAVEVQFQRVELSLAKGWVPRLGLELHNIALQSRDQCVTPSRVTIDRLYLPISIPDLLSERLKFKTISADKMTVLLRPSYCQPLSIAEVEATVSKKKSAPSKEPPSHLMYVQYLQKFMNDRWPTELVNSREWFEGLSLQRIEVLKSLEQEEPKSLFIIQDLETKLPITGDRLDIGFSLRPHSELLGGVTVGQIHFDWVVTQDKLQTEAVIHFQEGRWLFNAQMDVAKAEVSSRFTVSHMPMQAMVRLLNQWRPHGLEITSRLLWFSCEGTADWPLFKTDALVAQLSDCRVEGEGGHIAASTITVYPLTAEFKPFEITVRDLELEKWVSMFSGGKVFGSSFYGGVLSGQLNVNARDRMNLTDGVIKNISVQLARSNQRQLQPISEIHFEASLEKEQISAIVNKMDIQNGMFDGSMSVSVHRVTGEGVAQFNIKNLSLSPSVEKLLLGGNAEAMEIYGLARFSENGLASWQGSFGVSAFSGEGWKVDRLKFKGKAVRDLLEAEVQFGRLELERETSYHAILMPTFLQHASSAQKLEFKDGFVYLKTTPEGGRWSRARASSVSTPVVFASRGEWQRGGDLFGVLSVDVPPLKMLKWEISGTYLEPMITPSAEMLRSLARHKPSLKIPSSASPMDRLNILKEVWSGDRLNKIKKFGKTVIESARQILPGSEKESSGQN